MPSTPGGGEKRVIAVVDDDESVRKAVTRLLRLEGYEVEAFGSGEAFLESHAAGRVPACVVLDIQLGHMTGFAVRDALARAGHPVPVVFISAHIPPDWNETAFPVGGSACLRKPFDAGALIDAIKAAID